MTKRVEKNILKRGNLAYYCSRKYFSKNTRKDIAKLYSFVRTVDDFVRADEPDKEAFKNIVRRWQVIKKTKDLAHFTPLDDSITERVLGNICYVVNHYDCELFWVDNYLRSAAMDVRRKSYPTIRETADYMHGSSEVMSLMVSKIMRLPNASLHYAKLQGRAFEIMNFLCDLRADTAAGRIYFPENEIKKFGLENLDETNALKHPEGFKKFIRFQLKRYHLWQKEANRGLQFVPRRMKIPLRTAIDMYAWMAKKIDKDPYIIFERKITPSRIRIRRAAATRMFRR